MNIVAEQIKYLEEKLLHTNFHDNLELLNELLSEDFEEVGDAGIISSRREVVEWLLHKDVDTRWSLLQFRIRHLSEDLVLAIYQAVKNNVAQTVSSGTMRSSIWRRSGNSWKMVFHQGSRILPSTRCSKVNSFLKSC